MNKFLIIAFIVCAQQIFGQNTVEVKRVSISNIYKETFENLKLFKDSGFYKGIEIFEKGLAGTTSSYEKYKMILNLGYLYSATKQYEKSIDMWIMANKEGIFFPFDLNDKGYLPYLQEYSGNKQFQKFMFLNDSIKNLANKNPKAEYFVNLPSDYSANIKYPLIIILHGGIGDNNSTYINWDSKSITSGFISVYPQGRQILGSYARKYGLYGIEDIKEIYYHVISKYPVDTSNVILAGQSAGGELAIRLSYKDIPVRGLLLAFPVKPSDFNVNNAKNLTSRNVKVVMICGEKDNRFFPGQQEISTIMDSVKIEHRFITYPDLGHGFPSDFPDQIDKGLLYLTEKNYD